MGLEDDGREGAPPVCAVCELRPQTPQYKPFCSKRCADVDLHRWLGGIYAIPVKPEEDEDGDANSESSALH